MFDFFTKNVVDESIDKQKEDLKKEHPDLYQLATVGIDCDSLLNIKENFGHNNDNPIPVNGVIGEIKYLNRLRCRCDKGILFHRLGSITNNNIPGNIDVFETVCLAGKHWDILYLHMYHPRRSVWLPEGYTFSDFHPIFDKYPFRFGTTNFDSNFPFGLSKFMIISLGEDLGGSFAKKYEELIKDASKFVRPDDHKSELQGLNL